MITRSLVVSTLALLIGCRNNSTPPQRPDATAQPAHAQTAAGDAAPENLLLTLRGATLRRAVPLLFPQAGAAEVVEQAAPHYSPGIAGHANEIDVDSPFAVAGLVVGDEEPQLSLFIAWPLKPGMQIAQDARAHRGYRVVSDGIFAPTAHDAGADAEHQCWVAQRPTVGWMLLCGKRDQLGHVAGFLRTQAGTPPENGAVLDADVRIPLARRLASRQLAQIDRQAPPRADGGVEALRRTVFEQARRSAALMTAIVTDADTLHGTVTQDENAMHLRATFALHGATSDQTRALVAAAAGRQAPSALVQMLPASVTAYVAGGFDRAQGAALSGGSSATDALIAAQAGPELARVVDLTNQAKDISSFGERVDGYSNEDGYSVYHIIRRTDAAQFVNDLRVALNSLPPRAIAAMGAIRFSVMPTPGFTGLNYLRIGQTLVLPPGVQLPPEQAAQIRAATEHSMLLVAEGDHVIAIVGRDPIGRYRAMTQTGAQHITATIAPNAVLAGRITPASFVPLFYGVAMAGLPQGSDTDPLEFALTGERHGEGARFELRADAPIATATTLRTIYEIVQQAAAEQAQRQMEAQQRMQQGGGGGGMMMRPQPRPRPQLDPSMLPPPPNLQLQAPR